MAFEPGDRIGPLDDVTLARFLAEPWNARIATVDGDGWPYLTPVWYDFDAEARVFFVVGREHAAWIGHIHREPRVALHVADDVHAQHTRVLVQGVAQVVEGPVAPARSPRIGALTDRLSLRYLGPDGPTYAARTADRPRVLIAIRLHRWRSWTGQEWHPRYRQGQALTSKHSGSDTPRLLTRPATKAISPSESFPHVQKSKPDPER